MEIFVRVFVLFCLSHSIASLEEGSPCNVSDDILGVCKKILECPYAIKLVNEDEKKPPMCKWEENTRIVCCPTVNIQYRTGVFEPYFKFSQEGVLRSSNMSCYYDGYEPFFCCDNLPDLDVTPEPIQCPRLPQPKLKTKYPHFTWAKCLEYQRYFNKCISNDAHGYQRQNTCPFNSLRIYGGNPALPKEFPHMAVIGSRNIVKPEEPDIVWIGGGSIISEKFILTAAHVLVDNVYGRARYALMGSLIKTDVKLGDLCNIIRTIPHPAYVPDKKLYDIALVELHERVKFNEFIRPICLPVQGREIELYRLIAGWGEINENGTTSDVLLSATVRENPRLCQNKFESSAFSPDSMICAEGDFNGITQDACKGDSGGPLMGVLSKLNCSYTIEGVVSYGPKCGGAAGVYTKVSKYLDWISENVWPTEWKLYNQYT